MSSRIEKSGVVHAPPTVTQTHVEQFFSSPIKFGAPSSSTFIPFSAVLELQMLSRESQFTLEPLTIKNNIFDLDDPPPHLGEFKKCDHPLEERT